MIPSFFAWLETAENPSLGAPMHKQGPKPTLDREVEERMLKMTKELMDGSASEQDILAAVRNYVNKKMPQTEPDSSQKPTQQDQSAEVNPVAQGAVVGNF